MKFDVLITCDMGLEEIVKKELVDILKYPEDKIELKPFGLNGKILIKDVKEEDIIKLNYCGRSFHRVILLLDKFEITKKWEKDKEIFYRKLKEIPFEEFITNENITFGVQTEKIGENFDYRSIDVGYPAGQAIIDRIKEVKGFRPKVFLDDPDIPVKIEIIENKVVVGIDTTGKRALFKRGWRVYYHPATLKSTTAFSMILLSEWNPDEVLLDPFCGSGTIPIEAALFGKNVYPGRFRKYDFAFLKIPKFKENYEELTEKFDSEEKGNIKLKIWGYDADSQAIEGAKKNARMAKVLTDIKLGVENVKYIFTRFDEKSVDKIVCNPPYGIRIKEKKLTKIYYWFFRNAVDILKDEGKIVMITTRATLVRELAKEFGFCIELELKIWYDKETHFHIFKLW